MKSYLALMLALGVCVAAAPAMAGGDHHNKGDMAKAWFGKMDANGDGVISINEHEKFSEKMFRKTDGNSDNMITWEEFENFKMREHRSEWEKVDKRGYNE